MAVAEMQGDHVEFHLVKCQGLQGHHQYQWQLADENNGRLSVSYEGRGDGVQVCNQDGALVAAIDLCRGEYYTVIKFTWRSATYRYHAKPKCHWPFCMLSC